MTETITINAEEEKSFQSFYESRLTQAGAPTSDREELAILRDILQAVRVDGLTPTADGGTAFVRRGALDWTDPTTVEAARAAVSGDRGPTALGENAGGLKDSLLGIGMLLAIIAGLVWYFGFRGQESEAQAEITPAAIEAALDATPTPLPTLEAELLADIVEAGVKTSLVVPRTLEVGGVSFVVQPVAISSGDWPYPDDERAVSWVYGTVVNYILGVEATAENKALLAALQAGDELLLRMSTGPAYRFAFADVVRVAPQASEVFRQTRPGLTLVLMGEEEGATRVVIRAVYLPQSELGLTVETASQAAAIGQGVYLPSGIEVTILSAEPASHPQATADRIALAVRYTVRNTTGRWQSTALFQTYLDADGLVYPTLPNDDIPARIRPGAMVTHTAHYLLPKPVIRGGSTWIFHPDPAAESSARVTLPPYTGPLGVAAAIEEVILAGDTLTLTLALTATLGPLTIQPGDLALQGAVLLPGTPPLPWQLAPGQAARYPLHLHPSGPTLQLALLEQGFELSIQ